MVLPETLQKLIDKYHPAKTILSSVINHDPQIETILASHSVFHKVSHITKLPFTTTVSKPETIGADRLPWRRGQFIFIQEKIIWLSLGFLRYL